MRQSACECILIKRWFMVGLPDPNRLCKATGNGPFRHRMFLKSSRGTATIRAVSDKYETYSSLQSVTG